MNWFPQLLSGSVSQLPFRRERHWRVVENRMESGARVFSPDVHGGKVTWTLNYQELSDDESRALIDLFTVCKGRYGSFGFVDPSVNLVAGSEDLSRPDWQMGLMTVQSGITDPLGTQRAWRITNSSVGDQDLQQTLSFPGKLTACFSGYVRSDSSKKLGLRRDSIVTARSLGSSWVRVFAGGQGDSGSDTTTFAIRIGAGVTLDVWGLQVEVQPFASQYKTSTAAQGIYNETYFAMDELRLTNTSPGRSSCVVQAVSRVK